MRCDTIQYDTIQYDKIRTINVSKPLAHNVQCVPIYQLFWWLLAGNKGGGGVGVRGGVGLVVEMWLRVLCLAKQTDKFISLNRRL